VHPDFGAQADVDRLIAEARTRNIEVWLDLVPNHTSDRHPWFTEQPEYYVWSKRVPNDWTSIFTGESAWRWSERRRSYYLHQFTPQQPDLDWWNADVHAEFERILRAWWDRGIAGFRIDVAHALIKDRRLRDGVAHMRDRPEVHELYARWQEVASEYDAKPTLMGETYVTLDRLPPYARHLDLCQNFAFVRAAFAIGALRTVVDQTVELMPAGFPLLWFGSNHDHSRMATRWAKGDPRKHRAALFLVLTLPGVALLYQGDEIGLQDGVVPPDRITDVGEPPRDPERTPMPWTAAGEEWPGPWLPLTDRSRNVEEQRDDPNSILNYTRALIAARKELPVHGYETLPGARGVWAYRRGERTCVLNMTDRAARYEGGSLEPWEGRIL